MAASLDNQLGQVGEAESLGFFAKQMLRWSKSTKNSLGKACERLKGEDAGLSKPWPTQGWHTGCP